MKRFSTMSMRPTPCLPLWGERGVGSQLLPQGFEPNVTCQQLQLGHSWPVPTHSHMQGIGHRLRVQASDI